MVLLPVPVRVPVQGAAPIDVTATAYAHVRLRLQRDVIDTLSTARGGHEATQTVSFNGDEPMPTNTMRP